MKFSLGKLNPVAALDRALDRSTARRIAHEKQYVVEGHSAERRGWFGAMAKFVVGMAAMIAAQWGSAGWDVLAWPVIGFVVGSSLLGTLRAPTAYRNGWIDGRAHMARSIAKTNSLTPSFEYDAVHVLGYMRPDVPDTPEGLE